MGTLAPPGKYNWNCALFGPPVSMVYNLNDKSIGSAIFAQLMAKCRACHGIFFSLIISSSHAWSGSYLTHASFRLPESITQMAYRLVQPFLHGQWSQHGFYHDVWHARSNNVGHQVVKNISDIWSHFYTAREHDVETEKTYRWPHRHQHCCVEYSCTLRISTRSRVGRTPPHCSTLYTHTHPPRLNWIDAIIQIHSSVIYLNRNIITLIILLTIYLTETVQFSTKYTAQILQYKSLKICTNNNIRFMFLLTSVVFTKDRILIKFLRQDKCYSARQLFEEFSQWLWFCSSL